MPSTGSNVKRPQPAQPHPTRPHPVLDEESFQNLLAAAFTIQEHNDRRRQAQPVTPGPEATAEPPADSICPHCGAPQLEPASSCTICGSGQFRPGERLQRNWASMWLMSQERGLWPGPSTDGDGATEKSTAKKAGKKTRKDRAPLGSASNALAASPPAKKIARKTTVQAPPVTARDSVLDEAVRDLSVDDVPVYDVPLDVAEDDVPEDDVPVLGVPVFSKPTSDNSKAENTSGPETHSQLLLEGLLDADLTTVETQADSVPAAYASDDPDLIAHALELSESAENDDPLASASNAANYWQRFADLSVKLSFNRADLYLAAAVFIALLALLWPAATLPHRAVLRPWQRALITLGIAQAAPVPAVHFPGDPTIQVWIDPHTALYYCPGEEQYGKTADGRFSSQRDAQMDRFDPAGRSVCE
jgi:ribosomal protein L40E